MKEEEKKKAERKEDGTECNKSNFSFFIELSYIWFIYEVRIYNKLCQLICQARLGDKSGDFQN